MDNNFVLCQSPTVMLIVQMSPEKTICFLKFPRTGSLIGT